jgi:hypothetical protein
METITITLTDGLTVILKSRTPFSEDFTSSNGVQEGWEIEGWAGLPLGVLEDLVATANLVERTALAALSRREVQQDVERRLYAMSKFQRRWADQLSQKQLPELGEELA